jgi:choline-sulfatase
MELTAFHVRTAIVKRALTALVVLLVACTKPEATTPTPAQRPSILLVTLDTTRADAIGPDTPAFNAIAGRGRRFRQAYATTPQTLPSHTSMMTGLYPAGHMVHENGRYVSDRTPLLAERLRGQGYRTAAFISAFALARRFGLARGFELYDEDFGNERVERTAEETTDRALRFLESPAEEPLFLWVHYYDPHYPYTPPAPFLEKYAGRPYQGEVAAVDRELGRLTAAFLKQAKGPAAIVISGDHGEGLGDHGEAQHGNLLYQSTMHVPLVISGPGVTPGVTDAPVSIRTIHDTILEWAGVPSTNSLRSVVENVIVGEAMKPFLDYGWQPQVMAVEGRFKTILAGGKTEVYDVIADPLEKRDLTATAGVPRAARSALRDYPIVSAQAAKPPANLSEEESRKLASLGYVAATARPVVRPDAPRPADMASLFDALDEASALFVRGDYVDAIPLLEKILATDTHNLDAALRLATSHSSLGQDRAAEEAFRRAEQIAPESADVRMYFGLHLARGSEWPRAVPMLERIVAEDPDRLPALQALAVIRERQGSLAEAVQLRQKVYAKRSATAAELLRLGEMAMEVGRTPVAIEAFEKARALDPASFRHDLELGVLYLSSRRFAEARDALDRIPSADARYPMAAFKRAQVSVLLHEPDAPARIAAARAQADDVTRELIARERLFQQ